VTTAADYTGWYFHDFKIQSVSGTPARYGINFGYGSTTGLNRLTVERVSIGPLGSYSVLVNGAGPTTIENNYLSSISFNSGVDNLNILNNTINSTRPLTYGIYVKCVSGSNMLNIKNNVIVGAGTRNLIFVEDAGSLTIADNQLEAQGTITGTVTNPVTGGTFDTLIHLEGTNWQMYNPIITGNNFNGSPTYCSGDISINSVVQARVHDNVWAGGTAYPFQCLWISANAIGTTIGPNFGYSTNTGAPGYTGFYNSSRVLEHAYDATYYPLGRINDAGYGTVGIWKLLTLYNGDITRDSNYEDLCVIKETDQTIRISGGVSVATAAENKVICQLPDGFQPAFNHLMAIVAYNDTDHVWVPVALRIDTSGGVYLNGLPAGKTITKVIIDCAFKHYYE
jgi:hypothetical protein